MNGRVALCADDLGLSVPVSAAIVELASRGRLQGVACRTSGSPWADCAALLRPHLAVVEAGLHLNLTEGRPLSAALGAVWPEFPALPRLRRDAFLGRLPLVQIEAELHAQWQAFEQRLGHSPDFVSAHQHVHQLPGVRQMVLSAVARCATPPAVRNTGRLAGPGGTWTRTIIEWTGGRALQASLRAGGVPHNAALLGVGASGDGEYRSRMKAWLSQVTPEGALLLCRPGVAVAGDRQGAARERERRYLGGRDFVQDLADARVEVGPVWRIVGATAAAR